MFIHSLFRSGSTYLYHAFKRSPAGYWCYQEPYHEALIQLNGDASELQSLGRGGLPGLRHPPLQTGYFHEFWEVRAALAGLFRTEFSYDSYFLPVGAALPDAEVAYLGALIGQARGRPVLQFCRSSGRAAAMRAQFGGIHLHLWREPRAQWWSFKASDYFDVVVRHLMLRPTLPAVLRAVVRLACWAEAGREPSPVEQQRLLAAPALARSGYTLFFGLWLWSALSVRGTCQLEIQIEDLAGDPQYRAQVLQRLSQLGLPGIDFADCDLPRPSFDAAEQAFFAEIEQAVVQLFQSHGFDAELLDRILAAGRPHGPSAGGDPRAESNARATAVWLMERRRQIEIELDQERWRCADLQEQLRQLQARLEASRSHPGSVAAEIGAAGSHGPSLD